MSAEVECPWTYLEGNTAWKVCAEHGVFPVWHAHCPGPEETQ